MEPDCDSPGPSDRTTPVRLLKHFWDRLVDLVERALLLESTDLGIWNRSIVVLSGVFMLLILLVTAMALDPAPRFRPSASAGMVAMLVVLSSVIGCMWLVREDLFRK